MSAAIILTDGTVCTIDAEDADLSCFGWWKHVSRRSHTAYARRERRGNGARRVEYLHRVIGARIFGDIDDFEIDHADGNGLNNCRDNLRLATRAQNARNVPGRSASGLKGAYWFKRRQCWRSAIGVNGKFIHLGYFATKEEAHSAYRAAALQYFGEFARFE